MLEITWQIYCFPFKLAHILTIRTVSLFYLVINFGLLLVLTKNKSGYVQIIFMWFSPHLFKGKDTFKIWKITTYLFQTLPFSKFLSLKESQSRHLLKSLVLKQPQSRPLLFLESRRLTVNIVYGWSVPSLFHLIKYHE